MAGRYLAILQYDGARFMGWQRQSRGRTVQGELERCLEQLFQSRTVAHAAGRTDRGVHALGQAVSFDAPARWTAPGVSRALNALLPSDMRVTAVHSMRAGFHARRGARARRYRYLVGTDADAWSPFRRTYEWAVREALDVDALEETANTIRGEHNFQAFAVVGPPLPHYRCRITRAEWRQRSRGRGHAFTIESNRFLHRMVRFLVGTMLDIAAGRRAPGDLARLLHTTHNQDTSRPAPPHGLYLVGVRYPSHFYAEERS